MLVVVNYFSVVFIGLELLDIVGSKPSLLTLPVLKNLLPLDARCETVAVIVTVSFSARSPRLQRMVLLPERTPCVVLIERSLKRV